MSETPAEAYARALLDAATFVRGGAVGMMYGTPGEMIPAEKFTEICMDAFKTIGDVLTDRAVKLGAANAPPPVGSAAAVEQGCNCAPAPMCPIHGLFSQAMGVVRGR